MESDLEVSVFVHVEIPCLNLSCEFSWVFVPAFKCIKCKCLVITLNRFIDLNNNEDLKNKISVVQNNVHNWVIQRDSGIVLLAFWS